MMELNEVEGIENLEAAEDSKDTVDLGQSDVEFLFSEVPDKVSRDVALMDFRKWLFGWGLEKKAKQKFTSSSKEMREQANLAKEAIVSAIQAGLLRLEKQATGKFMLVQTLHETAGNLSELEYKRIPKLKDMLAMDGIDTKLEGNAATIGLMVALTGNNKEILSNLSEADVALGGAVFFFLL